MIVDVYCNSGCKLVVVRVIENHGFGLIYINHHFLSLGPFVYLVKPFLWFDVSRGDVLVMFWYIRGLVLWCWRRKFPFSGDWTLHYLNLSLTLTQSDWDRYYKMPKVVFSRILKAWLWVFSILSGTPETSAESQQPEAWPASTSKNS